MGALSCYQFRSENTGMFWALPSGHHLGGDREALSVWEDSDFVTITPLSHPTKQGGVLGNVP